MSLRKRDYIFSKYVFTHENKILSYIKNMQTEGYRNIFKDFEENKKRNKLYKLIWILSSNNREIRDNATHSLIYILMNEHKLYMNLWKEYNKIDDLYILERLYLIGYGIIINSNNIEKILILQKNFIFLHILKINCLILI